MKKSHLLGALCAAVISLCVVVPAEAFLINRDGGAAAYDTVLDITWTTNAALSGRFGSHWVDQLAWADSLEYLGFDDWRLATISVSAGVPTGSVENTVACHLATEIQCRDNELGYMFYHNIGGSHFDLTGDHTVGDVMLKNVKGEYWSGLERSSDSRTAWYFTFWGGINGTELKDSNMHGWAVRDGDVAAVPEPPMALLLATGLLGLIVRARIKSA